MHNSTSYSIHGQLTNEVQNGGVLSRTYDNLNRPTGYSLCASASLRDDNSSRTSRTLREVKTTTYIWDNWNIIREIQLPVISDQWSVGTLATGHYPLVTDYVWGLDLDGTLQGAGGVGGLLAVIRSNSNSNSSLYFPTYDANGNVSEYVTTNGEIVAHYDYSPFGEPLVAAGPLAATFTHQFSTKPWCAYTGLVEYQKRNYRPDIGRWMSRDPMGELGGLNLYHTCKNNDVDKNDVLGEHLRDGDAINRTKATLIIISSFNFSSEDNNLEFASSTQNNEHGYGDYVFWRDEHKNTIIQQTRFANLDLANFYHDAEECAEKNKSVLDTIIRLQRRIETARYYLGRSPYSVSYLKTKPLGGE